VSFPVSFCKLEKICYKIKVPYSLLENLLI
jgi:hypothetical protein